LFSSSQLAYWRSSRQGVCAILFADDDWDETCLAFRCTALANSSRARILPQYPDPIPRFVSSSSSSGFIISFMTIPQIKLGNQTNADHGT
jgi:hypothetical protein